MLILKKNALIYPKGIINERTINSSNNLSGDQRLCPGLLFPGTI